MAKIKRLTTNSTVSRKHIQPVYLKDFPSTLRISLVAHNTCTMLQTIGLEQFVTDLQLLCGMIADGPLKSFCFQRLEFLQSK